MAQTAAAGGREFPPARWLTQQPTSLLALPDGRDNQPRAANAPAVTARYGSRQALATSSSLVAVFSDDFEHQPEIDTRGCIVNRRVVTLVLVSLQESFSPRGTIPFGAESFADRNALCCIDSVQFIILRYPADQPASFRPFPSELFFG